MSSSTLSMVSCVLMFLILHHTKESEAVEVCSFTDQLPGKCGNDGSNKCVNAMQKKALLPEVKVARFCDRDMRVCDGADEMAPFKYIKTLERKSEIYDEKLLFICFYSFVILDIFPKKTTNSARGKRCSLSCASGKRCANTLT
ncbi:hypothetical protein YC2023_097057 [Brassica napus]